MDTLIQQAIATFDNECDANRCEEGEGVQSAVVTPMYYARDNRLICPVCQKLFTPATMHVYKQYHTQVKVCSYSCSVKSEKDVKGNKASLREHLERKIELYESQLNQKLSDITDPVEKEKAREKVRRNTKKKFHMSLDDCYC